MMSPVSSKLLINSLSLNHNFFKPLTKLLKTTSYSTPQNFYRCLRYYRIFILTKYNKIINSPNTSMCNCPDPKKCSLKSNKIAGGMMSCYVDKTNGNVKACIIINQGFIRTCVPLKPITETSIFRFP